MHLPCGKGHHVVDFSVDPHLNPDGVAKRLLAKGWTIGRKLTCPDCQRKTKKPKEKPAMAITLVPSDEPKPTPAAGRARRLVYMALEDYYDEGGKAYKPGHSDASIAKDCGVSEQLVKSIREESYGPLAEPSELAALRAALVSADAAATAAMAVFGQEVARIRTEMSALAKRNGWAI